MKGITYPYPSLPKLKAMFQKSGTEVENITEKDILTKFEHPTLINTERIRDVVTYLEKLRINNLVAKLIVRFRFYPSICIIAKKGDTK